MENKNLKNNNNNTVKILSILLGIAFFIILILVGIIVYLLVTAKTCDNEIYIDKEGEIHVNIPTEEKEVTHEQLERAKQEIIANGNYDTDSNGNPLVYWNTDGTKYHINNNCPYLHSTDEIMYGTLEAAFQKGITDACRICIRPR